jgi:D-lyxose ketol-isomerase
MLNNIDRLLDSKLHNLQSNDYLSKNKIRGDKPMITKAQQRNAQMRAAEMIRAAGIHITDQEAQSIEVVDFGLSNLEKEGVQVLTLVQTERISIKVLVLFPNQTEPEHWHPPVGDDPGKEETIRVISGTVYFYIPGEDTFKKGFIVASKEDFYSMRNESVMQSCDQITLQPGEKHWFQAKAEGAVMYSFSTIARDALDQFTDPNIKRTPKIVDAETIK